MTKMRDKDEKQTVWSFARSTAESAKKIALPRFPNIYGTVRSPIHRTEDAADGAMAIDAIFTVRTLSVSTSSNSQQS
jgi:hypothetical protein